MFQILVAILIGVNFAPLILPQLDMWHAQGFWVQAGILLLFSWSFFEKGSRVTINKPLGLLILYIGIATLCYCFVSQTHQKYDTLHFFPYFNFLCLIVLYQMIVSHINKAQIEKILEYMRWALVVTCFICVLQFFGYAQFFEFLQKDHAQFNNMVTGFIGNGTHLSGFLAMCVPLLFLKWRRENLFILILIILILTQAGTSKNDPSASGFTILIFISYYYLYFKNRKAFWWATLIGFISVSVLFCVFREMNWFIKFVTPTGRMKVWEFYHPLFKKFALLGSGLGTVNKIFKLFDGHPMSVIPGTRHLHLEYYHFALEIGIIGLVLILNVVKEFFSGSRKDNTILVLQTIVLGFLLSCFFNFPAHLWLPSTYAMFCYAGIYAIKNKELNQDGYFDEG